MPNKKEAKFMQDAVELLKDEVKDGLGKLAKRDHSPREIALAMIGGPQKAADLFGISRQGYYKRKNWPVEWYVALMRITGIPVEHLTMSAKEYSKHVENERKKMEGERKKLDKLAPNGR